MDDNNLKIFDNRVPYKAGKNYEISKVNEEIAMQGFVIVMSCNNDLKSVWSEKIESDESWLDGKLHVKPDFFVHAMFKNNEVKTYTIEVKTTQFENFLNDEIIIKAPQVWTCKNNPDIYPLPYILAATNEQFALIPMGSFWNSPPAEIDFGDFKKKGYLLNANNYKWENFITRLNFKKNYVKR